jgi:enediyne biosynthesis protein CalE5
VVKSNQLGAQLWFIRAMRIEPMPRNVYGKPPKGRAMTSVETFDSVAFKEAQRADWQLAASGWRRWHDVLEAEAAGQVVSRKLVEVARLGPGESVLDVASGYGEPALTAARAVTPGGHVTAIDIAPDLLAFGRERAHRAGLDNVEFREADAETFEFTDETFDAVLSRQGLQFLPDVAGTLKRLRSALKRGGRLAAAVWGPPETLQFALPISIILRELSLPPPPSGRPGAFQLADRQMLAQLVADAGFRDIEIGTVTVIYETASAEDCTQWIRDVAPPIAKLTEGQPAEVVDRVWRQVTTGWTPLLTSEGRVRLSNQAVWVAATN